jgi:hypothetical protein
MVECLFEIAKQVVILKGILGLVRILVILNETVIGIRVWRV